MTNMIKKLGAAFTVALAVCMTLSLAPLSASAESLGEMQIKELSQSRSAYRVEANSSTCVNLTYVGSSTEAVVTITDDVITAYAPGNTLDSSDFGVSGSSYTLFSTAYDTVGELCDVIDALTDYECSMLGCKRDDNTNLLRDQTQASGTNDLKAAGGFDVRLDTGSDVAMTNTYTIRAGITPGSGKRVRLKTCTGNINAADSLRVHGKLKKYEGSSDGVTRDDTTVVWRATTADDTDLQIPADIIDDGWLDFAKDGHVVISGGHGTGVQVGANFLECLWTER